MNLPPPARNVGTGSQGASHRAMFLVLPQGRAQSSMDRSILLLTAEEPLAKMFISPHVGWHSSGPILGAWLREN
jgi:hypothetical protein